jgi:hypothetical protein
VHRIGEVVLDKRAVRILPAEQLLFHLPPQCGTNLRVSPKICHRLVEAFGYHRQTAGSVDDVARAFLNEEKVIRGATIQICRPSNRAQG